MPPCARDGKSPGPPFDEHQRPAEMFGYTVRTRQEGFDKVARKVKRENPKRIGHGAAILRKIARRSIRKSNKPAPAGRPPRTRRGQLRRAILYALIKRREMAMIGPSARIVGIAGAEHELRDSRRKPIRHQRPFMRPSLEKAAPNFPNQWEGFLR